MKRLSAIWLCFLLLASASFAAAKTKEEAAAPVPYTSSESAYTESGVTVRGERAKVDFDWLRSINPDTVGWLYQEETLFSWPVLQPEANDEYYLHRGFDKVAVSGKGMPYILTSASPELDEAVVLIYGNSKEGACFQPLNEYRRQAYADEHPSLRLLTPAGDWQLDVFACLKTTEKEIANWLPGEDEPRRDWLLRLAAKSGIEPAPERAPKDGERIAVLVARQSGDVRRLIFAAMRPITYETEKTVDLNKIGLDRTESVSGPVTVDGLGTYTVYAQNDPLWQDMRYESAYIKQFRRFGGGGCGPTAVAIILANLVDKYDLPRVKDFSADGLGTLLCPCSVNRVMCTHLHAPYHLETADDYLRYLPIIVADIAAGNNTWGINSRRTGAAARGSNMQFLEPLLTEVYGLRYTKLTGLWSGVEAMRSRAPGEAFVLCCALRGSFTSSSHFMVMFAADEESVYLLDPLFRTDYSATDKYNRIDEIIAPGVVRVSLTNLDFVEITVVGIVEKPEPGNVNMPANEIPQAE